MESQDSYPSNLFAKMPSFEYETNTFKKRFENLYNGSVIALTTKLLKHVFKNKTVLI